MERVTNGIAREFGDQMVVTMRYVDQNFNQTFFESYRPSFILDRLGRHRCWPLWGDGQGLAASTLENGNTLPSVDQCLNTPFDNCPPERVGLAATNWMILAEQQFDLLAGTRSDHSGFFGMPHVLVVIGMEWRMAEPLRGLERLGEASLQEFTKLGCSLELRDGIQFLERPHLRFVQTTGGQSFRTLPCCRCRRTSPRRWAQ